MLNRHLHRQSFKPTMTRFFFSTTTASLVTVARTRTRTRTTRTTRASTSSTSIHSAEKSKNCFIGLNHLIIFHQFFNKLSSSYSKVRWKSIEEKREEIDLVSDVNMILRQVLGLLLGWKHNLSKCQNEIYSKFQALFESLWRQITFELELLLSF